MYFTAVKNLWNQNLISGLADCKAHSTLLIYPPSYSIYRPHETRECIPVFIVESPVPSTMPGMELLSG